MSRKGSPGLGRRPAGPRRLAALCRRAAFGCGIALYFAADHEPVLWVVATTAVALALGAVLLRRSRWFASAIMIAAIAAGRHAGKILRGAVNVGRPAIDDRAALRKVEAFPSWQRRDAIGIVARWYAPAGADKKTLESFEQRLRRKRREQLKRMK